MFKDRIIKRTWGWYFTLLDRKHFKVKLLKFNDKCTCSLQYHRFRNELWLFLRGKGVFTLDGNESFIDSGDYILVKYGVKHKYFSVGCSLVIEIQYGEKCDEKDIIRA